MSQPKLLYQTNTAPTTFHPMPSLPIELQLRIYEFADFTKPRTITTLPKAHGNKIPALLHACLASRIVLRRKYARFQATIALTTSELSIRYAFFINLAADTLIIDSDVVSSRYRIARVIGIERFGDAVRVFPEMMEKVRLLTLTQEACELGATGNTDIDIFARALFGAEKLPLRMVVEACPNLEHLTVVLGEKRADPVTSYTDGGDVDPSGFVSWFLEQVAEIKTEQEKLFKKGELREEGRKKLKIDFKFWRYDPTQKAVGLFDVPVPCEL